MSSTNLTSITEDNNSGKISTDRKNNLNKRLKRRMSRLEFNKKFQSPFNKNDLKAASSRLESLFAIRPSRKRLYDTNIMKKSISSSSGLLHAKQLELMKEQSLNKLNKLIKNRTNRHKLVNLNIIKENESSSANSLSATRAKMKQFQRSRLLNHKISSRPNRNELTNRGILMNMEVITEETEEEIINEQSKLKLTRLIRQRSTEDELIKRNILKKTNQDNHDHNEQKYIDKKHTISNFLLKRPSLAVLKQQKLITDIGISPYLSESLSNDHDDHNQYQGNNDIITKIKNISNIKQISAAWGHTALLDDNSQLRLFGNCTEGRLGLNLDQINDLNFIVTPTILSSIKLPVSYVNCGDNHTAAIINNELYTWGVGSWGRLGLGDQESRYIPTKVSFNHDQEEEEDIQISSVVCGSCHTIVLTNKNKVYGFGWNKNGRLGIGREYSRLNGDAVLTPTSLAFINSDDIHITTLASGNNISAAVDIDGNIYTWGSNAWGALAQNDEILDCYIPQRVEYFYKQSIKIKLIAVGSSHMICSDINGNIYSWGLNKEGQLGRIIEESRPEEEEDGNETYLNFTSTPNMIKNLKNPCYLACGKSHTAIIIENGQLYTFGNASRSILGHQPKDDKNYVITPTLVEQLKDKHIIQVACSWVHTVALDDQGQVYTWGNKQYGKLGY